MFYIFVLFNVYVILQYNKLSIVLSSEYCFLQSQKQMSMTRKCYNRRSQTNPQHREEETQNTDSHMSARTRLKQSNQPPPPHQDDCKTRKDRFRWLQYILQIDSAVVKMQKKRFWFQRLVNDLWKLPFPCWLN